MKTAAIIGFILEVLLLYTSILAGTATGVPISVMIVLTIIGLAIYLHVDFYEIRAYPKETITTITLPINAPIGTVIKIKPKKGEIVRIKKAARQTLSWYDTDDNVYYFYNEKEKQNA